MEGHFFIFNQRYHAAGTMVAGTDNRALRYGDGLFETMRLYDGNILNAGLHFERLFSGMHTLQMERPPAFMPDFFTRQISELAARNQHTGNARVRLSVFRGHGDLFHVETVGPDYIIETFPLGKEILLSEKGISIDVYPDARKSCDAFSNLKSANYLHSVMAGLFAQNNQLDDAFILNAHGRICESAIANIFIIKDAHIFTPPLSEGCVAGTMRRWMLENFSLEGYTLAEKKLTLYDLPEADEIFLTNAVSLIRWVAVFGERKYGNRQVKDIFAYVKQNLLQAVSKLLPDAEP